MPSATSKVNPGPPAPESSTLTTWLSSATFDATEPPFENLLWKELNIRRYTL